VRHVHAPKLSEEAVTQAYAAVSRACTILTKDYIQAEGKTAYVNKERCMACGFARSTVLQRHRGGRQGRLRVVTPSSAGLRCLYGLLPDERGGSQRFNNEEVLAQIWAL